MVMKPARLEALADGIFAIVMTILVFEDEFAPQLYPITVGRPAYAISCGAYRLVDWLRTLGGSPLRGVIRAHLSEIQRIDFPDLHASSGLKGKIVILGGLFPDLDQHLTPMTSRTHDRMPGAVVHGHIVAEMVDGRGIGALQQFLLIGNLSRRKTPKAVIG